MVAQAMITEYHVQRSPEECARHLLLEVVLTACNDWLICRSRSWVPMPLGLPGGSKFPSRQDIAELREFWSDGWCDRILHMAGSSLCSQRILSALEKKPRTEFSRKKGGDRSSESCMLHGSDDVCIVTGEADTPIGGYDMLAACNRWLEKREDGYVKRRWNDLEFNERLAKKKRSNTEANQTNQTT